MQGFDKKGICRCKERSAKRSFALRQSSPLVCNGIAAELHSTSSSKERWIRNDSSDFVKALPKHVRIGFYEKPYGIILIIMDAEPTQPPIATSSELPPVYPAELPPSLTPLQKEQIRRQRIIIITLIIMAVVLVAAIIASIIYLTQPDTDTARIRDIMIIFMAFEMMILGVSMVILMIQLATLINLLQNDIKPILDSTNETANTLRGTAMFLSNNLSEPVIKLNEYTAGLLKFAEILGLARRR